MMYLTYNHGERYIPDFLRLTRDKPGRKRSRASRKSESTKEFAEIRALEAAGVIPIDVTSTNADEYKRARKGKRKRGSV